MWPYWILPKGLTHDFGSKIEKSNFKAFDVGAGHDFGHDFGSKINFFLSGFFSE